MDNNRTYASSSHEKTWIYRPPLSSCIPWLVVFITECLAIVILNIITIIVFVKQRQLQRRSTYLIIHLAIVDLLAGAVSGPLQVRDHTIGCFFEYDYWSIWSNYLMDAFATCFPLASLINLAVISLERLHATFFPFRHRVLRKWVYGAMIVVIWLATASRAFLISFNLFGLRLDSKMALALLWSYYLASLFIICASCVCICIKVRCSAHPHHHGATSRERKLTSTLLVTALVSLLSWLPYPIFRNIINYHTTAALKSYFDMTVITLYLANSLVNPIIYSLRMPELRARVAKMFRRTQNHVNAADLPLPNH